MLRRALVLVVAVGAAACASAAEAPTIARKPYTVLMIVRYDGTVTYEAIRSKEAPMRAREIRAEFPIIEAAHQMAREQWAEWFREKKSENAGREWVLDKPAPPKFKTYGTYEDEFDAEDKARELNSAENAKRVRLKKNLREGARRSRKALNRLDNMEENRKLVRDLIPSVHERILSRERSQISKMNEAEKMKIWKASWIAQKKAEYGLRADTKDEEDNPVEPDILDLYNAKMDAIEPILKRHNITERQWCIVWEEGYMHRWEVPEVEKPKETPKAIEWTPKQDPAGAGQQEAKKEKKPPEEEKKPTPEEVQKKVDAGKTVAEEKEKEEVENKPPSQWW